MFIWMLQKTVIELILADVYKATGIGLTSNLKEVNVSTSYFEVSMGDLYADIPKEELRRVFKLLDVKMKDYYTHMNFTEV